MARQPEDRRPLYGGHGIAEWYGAVFRNLDIAEQLARAANQKPVTGEKFDCPFTTSFPPAAPRKEGQPNLKCTKSGGVCSLRAFFTSREGEWFQPPEQRGRLPPLRRKEIVTSYGGFAATCPMRFVENGTAFTSVAEAVLGTSAFEYVKEVGFLQRVLNPDQQPENVVGPIDAEGVSRELENAENDDQGELASVGDVENVGRIDTILVDSANHQNWCAVELQAVYFSGGEMGPDFTAIKAQVAPLAGSNEPVQILAPAKRRRPDFRSSGPKRLLPQLQIKVPTLRRWGKKMAVIVDAGFFNSLGPMEHVDHVSNADIVWCVVTYDETPDGQAAPLRVSALINTTLESAIVGLTAGKAVTKPEFERRIKQKIGS